MLTGNAGPNAFNVLQSAGVRVFIARGGMGCGMGMGRRMWGGYAPPTAPQPSASPPASREELSSPKGEVKALSEKLDQVLKRLDRLEKRE